MKQDITVSCAGQKNSHLKDTLTNIQDTLIVRHNYYDLINQ